MIEVRNLSFSYANRAILRDISFLVSPGEIVSVVGANGAGKTTLLRSLATLAVPEGGLLLLDGLNMLEQPTKYRRQMGYLPESSALEDDMIVRDYLMYRVRLKGELPKRQRRRVNEAMEMCRLTECAKEPIRRLSAGVRRRVALADAILLRPRVLLLDDFLSGLDAEMRAGAGSLLSEAAAFSSVIVTGHELSDFAAWSTRFLVLRGGTIAATISTAGVDRAQLVTRVSQAIRGEVK